MPWYSYVVCFLAGTSLASGVPRFVKGICGEPFPTAFVKLSSPIANVLEGLLDFIVGAILFSGGHVSTAHPSTLILFIAGVAFTSVLLSRHFQKQHFADPASPKTP